MTSTAGAEGMAWTRPGEPRLGRLTALVGRGYFLIWTVVGAATFAAGVVVAPFAMQEAAWAHTVPLVVGLVVLAAGRFHLTGAKPHYLASCREAPMRSHRVGGRRGRRRVQPE